jgi:glycerol kinase
LIEATAFGAPTIIRRMEEYGIRIDRVVNTGGLSLKNATLMQIYADILGRPLQVAASEQTCALGAAMFGAVSGGGISLEEVQRNCCRMRYLSCCRMHCLTGDDLLSSYNSDHRWCYTMADRYLDLRFGSPIRYGWSIR